MANGLFEYSLLLFRTSHQLSGCLTGMSGSDDAQIGEKGSHMSMCLSM